MITLLNLKTIKNYIIVLLGNMVNRMKGQGMRHVKNILKEFQMKEHMGRSNMKLNNNILLRDRMNISNIYNYKIKFILNLIKDD